MFILFSILFYLSNISLGIPFDTTRDYPNDTLIQIWKEDITGNKQNETIKLSGTRLAEQSDFYPDVTLSISNSLEEVDEKRLAQGYDPEVSLINLTNNKHKQLFYKAALNKNKTEYTYELVQLNNSNLSEILLPKQENIEFQLKNNFLIEVKLPLQKNVHRINIADQKEQLIKDKLYNEKGILMKQKNLIPESTTLYEPIFLNEINRYGLKSTQYIEGLSQNKKLGSIQTTWYLEDDKWIILKTDWKN